MIVRASGAARALLRRRRVERDATIALFLLVAVTAFVAAAAPRWLDTVADAGIRHGLETATATQRNLQFSLVGQIPAQKDEPFARVDQRGETLFDTLPASVAETISARGTVIDSTRFSLADPPRYPTGVSLGYATGIEDQIEFVTGRAPRRVEPAVGGDPADPADPVEGVVPHFEIALAVDAAEATGMVVGETYQANADPSDPTLRTLFPLPTDAVDLTVVGLFRPIVSADPFWFDETRLTEATIGGTEDNPLAYVVGSFAPEAYVDLQTLAPLYYASWDYRDEEIDVGMHAGRWSEEREDYPAWPDDPKRPIRVIDSVGASFANLSVDGGWRRESWEIVSTPPPEREFKRSLSVNNLTKHH